MFMEDIKEKILGFMRQKGPILPVEVAKHINTNILMASAHLSELSSEGKLKVSSVKVGGSPLYYLHGQEPQLQRFSGNLHEKEKRAYDLLSQKKVLRDNEAEPLIRVTLRAIKDYAIPLQVTHKENSEIFWKWYLLSNKEAEELIAPFFKEKKEEVKEAQKTIEPEIKKEIKEPIKEAPEPVKETQKKIIVPVKKEKAEKIEKNPFLEDILNFFGRNKVVPLSRDIVRKGEIDFIAKVPSAVGDIEYYCKARDKKTINDADLASAFAQGQIRKLPVLFITNGKLTKRAEEILQKDFKGITIKRV